MGSSGRSASGRRSRAFLSHDVSLLDREGSCSGGACPRNAFRRACDRRQRPLNRSATVPMQLARNRRPGGRRIGAGMGATGTRDAKPTVLVVDDDLDFSTYLTEVLRRSGTVAYSVPDGVQ